MKRIALTHQEFVSEGVPAALHLNARTQTDFERWTAYIAERSEVTDVAFEFTTGTRRAERRGQYVAWLVELADRVQRPLNIFLRGGTEILPMLAGAYQRITVLDTNGFMKTTKRMRASLDEAGKITWRSSPTGQDESLDGLLASNLSVASESIMRRHGTAEPAEAP